ncbi:EF hand domain [Trypanosoma vivax]|uniref:PP2A regulatory subunit B'' EF-hand domain-containing protein n=1 Tax=Trypanosoma vivax (strain Y486) TaxID=1055687 RepID=G0TZD6_TRYVY|nr:EF hand domain [Trypanosoma vivax]CCC49339.1 conserved hypothetical protein [Trypanosoma vivax Y486]
MRNGRSASSPSSYSTGARSVTGGEEVSPGRNDNYIIHTNGALNDHVGGAIDTGNGLSPNVVSSPPLHHEPRRLHAPPNSRSSFVWRRNVAYQDSWDGMRARNDSEVCGGVPDPYAGGSPGRSSSPSSFRFINREVMNTGGTHANGGVVARSGSAPIGGAPSYYYQSPAFGCRVSSSNSRSASVVSDRSDESADTRLHSSLSLSQPDVARSRGSSTHNAYSQIGIRMKVLELLEYWMGESSTADLIEDLISDYLRQNADRDCFPTVHDENPMKTVHGLGEGLFGTEVSNTHRSKEYDNSRSTSPVALLASHTSGFTAHKHVKLLHESASGGGPSAGDHCEVEVDEMTTKATEQQDDNISTTLSPRRHASSPRCDPVAAPSPEASPSVPLEAVATVSSSALSKSGEKNSQHDPPCKGASYEDIPLFYSSRGIPRFSGEAMVGSTVTRKENPHFKAVDGDAITVTTCDSMGTPMGSAGGKAFMPQRNRYIAITPLKAVEDSNVALFVKREFSRLPSHRQNQNPRSLVGTQLVGFLNIRNGPMTRQEVNYTVQLTHALQRICTQCFGLPKYFAFLIVKILSKAQGLCTDPVAAQGCRPIPSPQSPSKVSPTSSVYITETQVLQLFEEHLRGCCINRRVFQLLMLCSASSKINSKAFTEVEDDRNTLLAYSLDRHYLLPEDFRGYIRVLLENHPGLTLLKSTPDIQNKYMETVIHRIFYDLDHLNRGYITYAEMECSGFIDALRQVDATDDINSVLRYFSYKHFYVLYTRFWELDCDHDMLLSRQDVLRYAPEETMNSIVADRILMGLGYRSKFAVKDRINYEEFVWFCLSEEDKTTHTAIRYWFRILDLDADGMLSPYELQCIYEETRRTLLVHGSAVALPFEDVICQVFDMLGVVNPRGITLCDLLSSTEAAGVIFNIITNASHLIQFEQRDPLVAHQERLSGGAEQTHWDRFAQAEYDRLSRDAGNE